MTAFRTVFPGDTIVVGQGADALTITSSGVYVPDARDAEVLAAAAAAKVRIVPVAPDALTAVVPSWSQRWNAALAGRDVAPADILLIGDSIGEGQGATLRTRRWIDRLQTGLRHRYPAVGVAGGEGFTQAFYLQTSFPTGWSYGDNIGSDGSFGFGHRNAVLRAPSAWASRPVTGTSVRVMYARATALGSFRVLVDGALAATVNTAAGATGTLHGGGHVEIPFATRGAHTVRIEWAAGGDVYLNGIHVYDQDENAGIRVTESAQYGSTSANWSTLENANAYTLSDDIALLQPALVLISLGGNDRLQQRPPATFRANLNAIAAQVRAACTIAPSIAFVIEYELGAGTITWPTYVQQLRLAVADQPSPVGVLSLQATMPPTSNNTLGLYATDAVHPSDRGHAYIADRALSFLAAAA